MTDSNHQMVPTKNLRWRNKRLDNYSGDELLSSDYVQVLQQLWISSSGWRLEWRELEEVHRIDEPDVIEGKEACQKYMERYHD